MLVNGIKGSGMNYSAGNVQRAAKRLIGICIIFFGLTACDDNTTTPDVIANVDLSVAQQEQHKAFTLLKMYFGSEMQPKNISRGPSGTIVINALNTETSSYHLLYMLPDQRHLIDGTLYSPDMTPDQISQAHSHVSQSRAAMNESIASSKAEMRRAISSAIANGGSPDEIKGATLKAVQERVVNTSTAKRTHNQTLIESTVPGITPPSTASLPRNNTVVNKNDLYKRIEASSWIKDGSSEKVIYVFFDFRCPACAEVHKYLEEHVANNDVQVRYVPVGALGPESLVRASLSLIPESNETRLKLMHQLSRPEELSQLIKIQPSPEELKKGQMAALQNFKLLLETQRVATPTFAYRTDAGPQIAFLTSREQLTTVIKNIVTP